MILFFNDTDFDEQWNEYLQKKITEVELQEIIVHNN